MKAMKVLVIDALARARGKRYSTFDVVGAGPRIVAGIIRKKGFTTELKAYELLFGEDTDIASYDIISISIMSTDKGALENILALLERKRFSGPVIVGGPASFEYNMLLKTYKRIDCVIVGEAEIPLSMLLERIDLLIARDWSELAKIPGLAFRSGKKIILSSKPVHTPSDTLSKIKPWTAIERSYPSYKAMRYYVEVLRGCSNFQRPLMKKYGLNCIGCFSCRSKYLDERITCPKNIPPGCGFCSVPYMFGPPRSREVKSIVNEVVELIEHGAKRIVLSAPDFLDYGRDRLVAPKPLTDPCRPAPNLDAIEALLAELSTLHPVRRRDVVIMIENIKACLVNEAVASLLGKYLKNTTVHIGLETGDDYFNEKILGKPITVNHVYQAVKLLSKHGLRPYVYLMYGLPFMSRSVYVKTIKAVKELTALPLEKITLYKYIRLPGTAFEKVKYSITGKEDLVRKLKNLVRAFNEERKKNLIGKTIEVYLAYSRHKYYGYPAHHGPVVFVHGLTSKGFDGCKALVRITGIRERYVHGKFIKILSC